MIDRMFVKSLRQRNRRRRRLNGTPCVFANLYGTSLEPEQRFEFAAAVEQAGGHWFMFIAPGSKFISMLATVDTCLGNPTCQSNHRRGAHVMLDMLRKLILAGFSVEKMRWSQQWPLPELWAGAPIAPAVDAA
jgi:hypothetical protein